jgi:tetratricopeptide (TPR) repeat protein
MREIVSSSMWRRRKLRNEGQKNLRYVYVLVAAACVLSFASACSSGSKPKPAATGSVDAKTSAAANDAVTKGLQAQAAGRLDEAAADYRQALALDPRNKFAFFDLGVIDHTQGRPDAAENNYRLALAIDPNFWNALFNLAILRTAAGSNDEATALYHSAAIKRTGTPNSARLCNSTRSSLPASWVRALQRRLRRPPGRRPYGEST